MNIDGVPIDEISVGEVPVEGRCDPRFAEVRTAFAANFARHGEVGGAVTVIAHGDVVVDLVGGWADAERSRPWRADTLVDVYSVGKAIVGLLLLPQIDAGLVGLDDPIASVWPEFGAAGKAEATIRHALCHRAGVPAIHETLTDDDLWQWDVMAGALAATAPWFTPGTRHTYHTNTYGHLIGELIHRITGDLPGARLDALAADLGADVYVGLPPALHDRCADIIWAPGDAPPRADVTAMGDDARMVWQSYFNPPGYSSVGVVNSARWRSAQVPSTNTHATSTGIAQIYQGLLETDRLLSPGLLAEAASAQSTGWCPVLGEDVTFGLGFKPTTDRRPFGPNPGAFGHFGTGGAVGFADPLGGVAFGYAMNHVIPRWQSRRNRSLIDAVYRCL